MKRVLFVIVIVLLVCGLAHATQWLKQSTAKTIKLGPFVDSTDGVTPETGLTISQADIRVSKNGGDFAQTNNAAGATHDENGWYDVPLDTTDTGTLGTLTVAVYESGALPVLNRFMIVPANVWDSFFGADYLQVDRIQVGGTANASATIANAFGGSTFQSVDDVFDEALSGHSTAGTAGKALTDIGTKTGYLPSATAGSAGGVFIAGSNAATSITTALTANITGNLSGSVGSVTNGVSLADDAITASKFDESTAFPLKSADTGSTAVARTGADSDTLETLSDQVDGVVSGSLTEEEMIASMRENLMEAAIDADPNTDSLFDIGARLGVLEAKLDSMIESDGSTGWEYTAASLINSPTGSGGFTEADRTMLTSAANDANAIDTSAELRTLLTGSDTAVSTFASATDTVTLANGPQGGNAAVLTLKQIVATNSDAGGSAVVFTGSGTGNSHALQLTSTNGKALAAGSTNSDAVSINSTNASGMVVVGATGDIVSDITGQVSGTASLLPTNFSTVTVADGKIASDGTVSLTEDDVTDIATAIANALNASGVALTDAERLAIVKAIEKILP